MTKDTSTRYGNLSPPELVKCRALLAEIRQCELRGAILPADACTLRNQLHSSTSGQWKAVETRLQQLACNWNPYQDAHRTGTDSFNAKIQKDKPKLDFYQLLELQNDVKVTTGDVKRQFRKLALQLHPDKKHTSRKRDRNSKNAEKMDDVKKEAVDSTQFARLRLAYETLSDPKRRTAYDAKLQEISHSQHLQRRSEVVNVQVKLEASTDFASLEWMARVKYKMDVMARIAEWAKLLSLHATELRFETGEPCTGKGCGKIVSMDRDLECSGSLRRRVYICLLHKYIHACDDSCTSKLGEAELDRRVCRMRAYWLIQNWLFDQLQAVALQRQTLQLFTSTRTGDDNSAKPKLKQESGTFCTHLKGTVSAPAMCGLEPLKIHLGDRYTRFQVENLAECRRSLCRSNFQFLEEGIYACRRHGTPHICTFEQCYEQELHTGRYVCWVSGLVYGFEREHAGTNVRTRRIVYADGQGEENAVELEVPVMLPLGKTMDNLLLQGDSSLHGLRHVSSLSPPPPDEKSWNKRRRGNELGYDHCADDDRSSKPGPQKRFRQNGEQEREMPLVRKCLHERLVSKIERSETTSFHIYLKLPPAVAILPKVVLEVEGAPCSRADDDNSSLKIGTDDENLLQIFVNSNHTVNYIKYWMEDLTEQQISVWDQQIFWSDTLIGDETNVMVLEEHGISAGCVLDLRLHDDCPLLVSTWNGKNAATGNAAVEYNTMQISKEAAEDLDDLNEEWKNVGAAEEQAFEAFRLKRKREKLELRGALEHTEVLLYDHGKFEPRLLGVIEKRALSVGDDGKCKRQLIPSNAMLKKKSETRRDLVMIKSESLVKEERQSVPREVEAMRSMSINAQPLRKGTHV